MAESQLGEIEEEYRTALLDLEENNKPMINMLTILANEKAEEAADAPALIVRLVESHLQQLDEDGRLQMFKVRQTWNEYFALSKLHAIDVKVREIDPQWPVCQYEGGIAGPPGQTNQGAAIPQAQTNTIHVNPRFIVGQTVNPAELAQRRRDELIRVQHQRHEQEMRRKQQEIEQRGRMVNLTKKQMEARNKKDRGGTTPSDKPTEDSQTDKSSNKSGEKPKTRVDIIRDRYQKETEAADSGSDTPGGQEGVATTPLQDTSVGSTNIDRSQDKDTAHLPIKKRRHEAPPQEGHSSSPRTEEEPESLSRKRKSPRPEESKTARPRSRQDEPSVLYQGVAIHRRQKENGVRKRSREPDRDRRPPAGRNFRGSHFRGMNQRNSQQHRWDSFKLNRPFRISQFAHYLDDRMGMDGGQQQLLSQNQDGGVAIGDFDSMEAERMINMATHRLNQGEIGQAAYEEIVQGLRQLAASGRRRAPPGGTPWMPCMDGPYPPRPMGPRDGPRQMGPRDGPRQMGPRDGPRQMGPMDGPPFSGPRDAMLDGPPGPFPRRGRCGSMNGPRRPGRYTPDFPEEYSQSPETGPEFGSQRSQQPFGSDMPTRTPGPPASTADIFPHRPPGPGLQSRPQEQPPVSQPPVQTPVQAPPAQTSQPWMPEYPPQPEAAAPAPAAPATTSGPTPDSSTETPSTTPAAIPPNKYIYVDGRAYEVLYLSEVAVIERSGLPHRIYFVGPPRDVIVDGVAYTLAFGERRTVTIDGQRHVMYFGGPSRELYLGSQPLRGSFGGPPIHLRINGIEHKIQLSGPPPEVKIDPDPDYENMKYMPNAAQNQYKKMMINPPPQQNATANQQAVTIQQMGSDQKPQVKQEATQVVSAPTNVQDLVKKLISSGLLPKAQAPQAKDSQAEDGQDTNGGEAEPPAPTQPRTAFTSMNDGPVVRKTKPTRGLQEFSMKDLRIRYTSEIQSLYPITGQQCGMCGQRFGVKDLDAYSDIMSGSFQTLHVRDPVPVPNHRAAVWYVCGQRFGMEDLDAYSRHHEWHVSDATRPRSSPCTQSQGSSVVCADSVSG